MFSHSAQSLLTMVTLFFCLFVTSSYGIVQPDVKNESFSPRDELFEENGIVYNLTRGIKLTNDQLHQLEQQMGLSDVSGVYSTDSCQCTGTLCSSVYCTSGYICSQSGTTLTCAPAVTGYNSITMVLSSDYSFSGTSSTFSCTGSLKTSSISCSGAISYTSTATCSASFRCKSGTCATAGITGGASSLLSSSHKWTLITGVAGVLVVLVNLL